MCPVSVARARCECSQPTNPVASNAGSKWKLKIRKAVGVAPSSTGTSWLQAPPSRTHASASFRGVTPSVSGPNAYSPGSTANSA
jgi:hypothetical protein